MKKLTLLLVLSIFTVCATGCTAEQVNKGIDLIGDSVGIDTDINITDEQLDTIMDTLSNAKNKTENIVEDEKVKEATKELIDSIKEAGVDK